MKKMLFPFMILLMSYPISSFAIIYFQSSGGKIIKIGESDFKSCPEKIIFRTSGKDELPPEYKKKLLVANLRGDVINDPQAASIALKSKSGSCSYSEKDDLN